MDFSGLNRVEVMNHIEWLDLENRLIARVFYINEKKIVQTYKDSKLKTVWESDYPFKIKLIDDDGEISYIENNSILFNSNTQYY